MKRTVCIHDPDDPWAYAAHRRQRHKPCPASLKAYAAYMKAYRIRRGLTNHRLVPITKDSE